MRPIHFLSQIEICKGWLGDRKFLAIADDGTRFLLRQCDIAQKAEKEAEFAMTQAVAKLGICMNEPIALWTGDASVFTLWSWIDGTDAEETIPTLPLQTQYAYGEQAGQFLQQIHTIPAPATQEDWELRFNKKIDRKIAAYAQCPIHYPNDSTTLAYIRRSRHLLGGRPQVYQHGDYHIGNMMLGTDKKLYIIDFNRNDYGDPWEEFNRIVWCAQAAPAFASGMVDGYFGGTIPMQFWQLLALYIAVNTLSSLPWAVPFGEGEIATMLRQQQEVLAWYDDFQSIIPTWYHPLTNA